MKTKLRWFEHVDERLVDFVVRKVDYIEGN